MRTLTLATTVLLLACTTAPSPPPPVTPSHAAHFQPPGYVRGSNSTKAQRVIVFVHGIFGNGTGTWTNDATDAYFPALVRDDPAFAGTDIWVYEYPSPKCAASYNIDQIPDDLHRRLTNDNVISNHREVIFVAHSMGGIVVRDYLLRNPSGLTPDRVSLLYFYSTPTLGSQVANIARHFCPSQQLNAMRTLATRASSELAIFENHWQNSAFRTTPTFCAYETQRTHGVQIVERSSATHLCPNIEALDRDHLTIAKPASINDDSYIAFRNAYRATISGSTTPRPTWNLNGKDQALLLIMNTSTSPRDCMSCWDSHATVAPGDVIALNIFAHNASTTPAYAVRTHLTVPTGPFGEAHLMADLRSPGTLPLAGSVYLKSEAGPVVLVPDSGAWFPEATKDNSLNENLPYSQTVNDALTPEGFLLGDISPGWGHQAAVVLRFRCVPATLVVIRDMAAALRSITQTTQLTRPDATSIIAAGHLVHSLLDNETQWVSDITNIADSEMLVGYVNEYNETEAPLHNVTISFTRTPTSTGEELHARVSHENTVRHTAKASLSYANKHLERGLFTVGLLWFQASANPCKDAKCAHSPADVIRRMTGLGDEVDGPIVIGDIPPKTGISLLVGILGEEPTGEAAEELTRIREAIEQSLLDQGLTTFDNVFLTTSRDGDRDIGRSVVDNVRVGESIVVTLHFANGSDLPLLAARATLVFARNTNTLTGTLTLRGDNTPAQATSIRVSFAPEYRNAQLRYVRAYRSYAQKAYSPIDAQGIINKGVALGDLAAREEGWLRLVYVAIPGAVP